MTAKENQIIEWQIKCITEEASRMKPNDLEWAIRMEDAYKKQGY